MEEINFWFSIGSTYTYLTVNRLHEVANNNKDWFFGEKGQEHDDLTFKNACEGSRAVNIEYRYVILSEIIPQQRALNNYHVFSHGIILENVLGSINRINVEIIKNGKTPISPTS